MGNNLSFKWVKLHSIPSSICLPFLSHTFLYAANQWQYLGRYFLVVIYVEEQPLCKCNRCFNVFWICHVKNIMQCYHNTKAWIKSTDPHIVMFSTLTWKILFLSDNTSYEEKSTPPTTICGWLWAAFSKK